MVVYGFVVCSMGSSMFNPTAFPPAWNAPLLAASMTPGPPPVTTVKPAPAISRPMASAVT